MKPRKAPPGLVRLNALRREAKVLGLDSLGTASAVKARIDAHRAKAPTAQTCVIRVTLDIRLVIAA